MDEVRNGGVRDQPTTADHDEVLGGQRHLAHQVRGDEHRPTLGRQPLEQIADPPDALRVQAVHRLVQDHGRGVAQQGGRDPQPLTHPEGEATRPFAGDLPQTDQVDHLVDPASRDPVRVRERQQMVGGRPAGMDRSGLQQRPDLTQRSGKITVATAIDHDPATGGLIQADNHSHGRRFAGTVRPQETRHHPRPDGEAQAVDRRLFPVAFCQSFDLNHSAPSMASGC